MSVREGNKRRGGKRALIKQTPLIPAVPKERFRHYSAKMPASLSISHNIYRHTHTETDRHIYTTCTCSLK